MSPARSWAALIAELAEQHAGAGRDPGGEVLRRVLAGFKLGNPRDQLVDHRLAVRSHPW